MPNDIAVDAGENGLRMDVDNVTVTVGMLRDLLAAFPQHIEVRVYDGTSATCKVSCIEQREEGVVIY